MNMYIIMCRIYQIQYPVHLDYFSLLPADKYIQLYLITIQYFFVN